MLMLSSQQHILVWAINVNKRLRHSFQARVKNIRLTELLHQIDVPVCRGLEYLLNCSTASSFYRFGPFLGGVPTKPKTVYEPV